MPDLTFEQQITRLKNNEINFDTFLNELGTYTASDSTDVETIRSFLARKDAEVNGLLPAAAGINADDSNSGADWTTVQGFINKILSDLGSASVGYDGGSVKNVLDNIRNVSNYAALRTYSGTATGFQVTGDPSASQPQGISGRFKLDTTDTTSGCFFVGSISGTTLTVTSITNGALAIGQAVNRGDTGATVGYITAGSGLSWTLSASATVPSMNMSADNGGTYVVRTSDGARVKRDFDGLVNIKWFGSKGDWDGANGTDNTYQIQCFVYYLADNHCHGFAPQGNYLISSKIDFPCTYGWGIIGSGAKSTIFVQYTDNVPIFDLGAIARDSMYEYLLNDIAFDYVNSQPSSNTNANPIKFSAMGFHGNVKRISFNKGSWGIKVASGLPAPWGQNWDELEFTSGLTGGAMDWTGSTSATPNNCWGRFFVDAVNMVGPIFKQIKGYNWTWQTLELLSGTNVCWIDAQSGSEVGIGAIKMEILSYTGSLSLPSNSLMNFPNGSVNIGQVSLGGTTAVCSTSNNLYLINGSAAGRIKIESLNTILSAACSKFYLSTSSGANIEISYFNRGSNLVSGYTDVPGTASADYVTVYPDKNDRISSNKGDADYTVTNGDPAVIIFQTTLTAPRTVNIISDNTCFNGLRYRIISYGAVNGANTITIKASGITKATLSADKTFIDFEWRRNGTPHAGWIVIGYGTLP